MSNISDNDLMNKVKQGSISFTGLLFERYKRILLAFFYNQINDKSICEDLVQVTFYKLIKYRKSFDSNKSFKAWIFTIARNSLKDEQRKKYKTKSQELESIENILADDGLADSSITELEKREFLKNALNQLSPEKLEVLTLVKIHEKKYKEVAKILNKKESTIKSIVFRAIQELQCQVNTTKNPFNDAN